MGNQTMVTEFILQGLRETKELQVAVFLLLLLIYLLTVSGNLTLISLTLLDTCLQTPMPTHISHLFCDPMPLMEVVCSWPKVLETVDFTLALVALLSTLVLINLSYAQIIWTIVRFSCAQVRRKPFSTCSSHVIVVTMCYGSCCFMYVKPSPGKEVDLNKGVSLINIVINPFVNIFIYTSGTNKLSRW
ncbi:olfactory receptor 6C76-like [Dugong dugon]